MPSIPQSLLWISLVVLWLFVLVPMLINKRDTVRRTSDVALATRVVNSGRATRLIKRAGPATGHRSDPHWRPDTEVDDDLDGFDEEETGPVVVTGKPSRVRSVAMVTPVAAENEPDYLDVDVVDEDSGALPVGASAPETPAERARPQPQAAGLPLEFASAETKSDESVGAEKEAVGVESVAHAVPAEVEPDGTADEYEYVDDTSGLEPDADEPGSRAAHAVGYASKTAAAVSARKYRFRTRILLTMAALLIASATAAFLLTPAAWYACATLSVITLLYLAYLRRQTRIEEQLRRRRMHRVARARQGVESTDDRELDVVPARLRRPGAAVLEIDDEDPVFEHLEYTTFAREVHLPRAAGQ